jgi:hypothetical protein
VGLANIALLDGKPDQALDFLRQPAVRGWQLQGVALVQHALGHEQLSQQALDQLIGESARYAAYQIAEVYAWRGQKEQAFQWLERAYAQRDGGMTEIKLDPLLRSLHTDPRFRAMLVKMKLAQ